MKKYFLPLLMLFSILFAACGAKPAAATETPALPTVTSAPDLCSEANLPAEVAKVNKLMREFDDYSALASNTPQQQLVVIIPELQRVLRDAEDQVVPLCLTGLKELQINHMTVVVQTLLAFVGSSDVNLVNEGINKARELHAQYDIEMARLLGITLVVPTSAPAGTQQVEPTTTGAEPTPTLTVLVTNPGPNDLNLRNAPGLNAAAPAILKAGESTVAFGRTADSQWVQVQVPNQPDKKAWVYASNVQLSVPLESLPVITP